MIKAASQTTDKEPCKTATRKQTCRSFSIEQNQITPNWFLHIRGTGKRPALSPKKDKHLHNYYRKIHTITSKIDYDMLHLNKYQSSNQLHIKQSSTTTVTNVRGKRGYHHTYKFYNARFNYRVVAERIRAPKSSSGVSDRRRVGSSPGLDTCVLRQDLTIISLTFGWDVKNPVTLVAKRWGLPWCFWQLQLNAPQHLVNPYKVLHQWVS